MSDDIYVKIQSLQSPLYDGMGNQIFCVSLDNVFISRDGSIGNLSPHQISRIIPNHQRVARSSENLPCVRPRPSELPHRRQHWEGSVEWCIV